MPELQQNFGTMRRYLPAVLRQNCMGWYIEYYAYNQISQELERKRMRVNRERQRARTFAEFRSITSTNQLPVSKRLIAVLNLLNITNAAYHACDDAAYTDAVTASNAAVPCCSYGCTSKACR